MGIHILFAKIAWYLLVAILLIRPLAELTGNKEVRFLMRYRKHLGIACGFAALLHVVIYIVGSGLLILYFTDGSFWTFTNLFGWGNVAFIALMIPFITSNQKSQRYFGRRWKTLQKFVYPAIILTGAHVVYATHSFIEGVLPVVVWGIIWLLAWYKKKCKKKQTNTYDT